MGKLAVPGGVVLGQATILSLAVAFGLRIHLPHPLLFWAIAVLGSLTFLAIISLLVRLFGDTGKVLAVLLLLLQISSAGGAFPVELSGGIYQVLHPFLPFTQLLKAFRATLFGAYGGHWGTYLGRLALTGALAFVLLGRWKHVPDDKYGPAMDV